MSVRRPRGANAPPPVLFRATWKHTPGLPWMPYLPLRLQRKYLDISFWPDDPTYAHRYSFEDNLPGLQWRKVPSDPNDTGGY